MENKRSFPNWEQLYQEQPVETMPWFHPELDRDLAQALAELHLEAGTVLDLGTGPPNAGDRPSRAGLYGHGDRPFPNRTGQGEGKGKRKRTGNYLAAG
ncbi:MAG: hypothetical protein ACRDEA_23140 [Microcystaceae cyanobacterium]